MDPASGNHFQSAVELQGAMLGRHEEELTAARQAVESLSAQVSSLSTQLHHLHHGASASQDLRETPEPRVNNPPCFSGEPTQCRAFLTQCEVVFSLQPSTYASDRARVAFVISLLAGRAREWGAANWEAEADCVFNFSQFKAEMIRVFDRSAYGEEASRLLSSLRQGRRSAADFAIEFRTLATTSGWNEPALVARFQEGLNSELKDEIIAREVPTRLDPLIDLAIRIERRFDLRRRARGLESSLLSSPPAALSSPPTGPEPEAMQLGGLRISTKERERRVTNRLCMYCASPSHFVNTCPVKARARQ
jgi:hypothetical protein